LKITFFSNFLNHHQIPFCKIMYEKLGDNFKFIATEPVPIERLKMGYSDESSLFEFVHNTFDSKENSDYALKLSLESDIVIIGSAPNKFVKERIKKNKLTFYYTERVFKKGILQLLDLKILSNLFFRHFLNKKKNVYLLCASAYTSLDFSLIGAYKNKAYKWGYFPEFKEHDVLNLIDLKKQNKIPKLIWVGRFLKWKHPQDAIKIGKMLNEAGYEFSMDIIGTGPLKVTLNKMINKKKLSTQIKVLGTMSPEEVRLHMEKANIFLFTSDFNEGWGAVLNESMNSGCGIVASHAIGSVPYMLKDNINSLIYKSGDIHHLFKSVKHLIDNQDNCTRMGISAYKTLESTWNAKEAATRLIEISRHLLSGERLFFNQGPLSKADIISQQFKSDRIS